MQDFNKALEKLYVEKIDSAVGDLKKYNTNNNNTLIGDYYESIVSEISQMICDKVPNVKLEISEGFIYNKPIDSQEIFEQSKQVDIIITFSNAKYKKLPKGRRGYYIDDVIATIEVKKNIDDNETIDQSFNNSISIAKLLSKINLYKECIGFLEAKHKFNSSNNTLAFECEMDYKKPTSFIFGFDGYKNEMTLRNKYKDILSHENKNVKFEYLYELPEIYFENQNCVMKMNRLHNLQYNGNITYFASFNNINDLLKMYLFKIYMFEAIARKADDKLYNEISKLIDIIPIRANSLFIVKEMDDIKIEGIIEDLAEKDLVSSSCKIKDKIKLTELQYGLADTIRTNSLPLMPCDENFDFLIEKGIIVCVFTESGPELKLNNNVFLSSTTGYFAYIIE